MARHHSAFAVALLAFCFQPLLAAAPHAPSGEDAYQHAGLKPEEAARAMRVPPGFQVTLLAGEPMVAQPIAQAFDDRGRLWVAEAYSYPRRVADNDARDRILIFEDRDGDGRFDSRKVFLDKLNLVSGLEVGFGGVWIGAAPNLLFVPDADGDDRPDGPPRVLLDGWGFHDTHETLNSFIWGPDGWLYGCHGVFTHSRVGKPGTPDDQRVPLNAAIWRYHPQTHEFEIFCHGTSNPWGVDFNDRGQAFMTACVIPHLYHAIDQARYQRQAGQHFNPYTYDDIKTIADHLHFEGGKVIHRANQRSDAAGGGHAHAGAMIYLGGKWPAEYRDRIFMNNIHGARINMDILEPRGSGFVGRHGRDFVLTNDAWSQIINLQYGPDGQMVMIDWYDKNQCHHNDVGIHDRTSGRIFKVSYGKPEAVRVDLARESSLELVRRQLSPNDWYVRHARRLLQERGPDAQVHAGLEEILRTNGDETRRLRALWALHVTGGISEARLTRTLADSSPWVRAWSVQLLVERFPEPVSTTLAHLARMAADDPSPVVRLYLASAACRLPQASRWSILQPLVRHSEDVADHNLPLMYWYALEPLVESDPTRALALAQQSSVPLVLALAVRRIGAIGTAQAIELLVEQLGLAKNEVQQRLYLDELARGLKGRRHVAMPAAWKTVGPRLVAATSARLRDSALALGVTFGDSTAIEHLKSLLVDGKRPSSERELALASLLKSHEPGLPVLVRPLLDDAALRVPALRALAAYDDKASTEWILDRYPRWSLADRQNALAALAGRRTSARALVAAIAARRIAATDLSADIVRQLQNLKDPEINAQVAALWGTLRETTPDKQKLMARYKQLMATSGENRSVGRLVFAKTCQQCHTLFGTGGKVGPDLTGSNRANLDYLLTNIVDPSAVIGRAYQAHVILTTDGRVLTGVLREDDRDSITLATATDVIVIPKDEIEQQTLSPKSMMPEDILKPFSDDEIRGLLAYLASPAQVPLPEPGKTSGMP